MAYIDGTIIRCGAECNCHGEHRKVAMLDGTSLEIVGRFSGHQTHKVRVSVFELLRIVGASAYVSGTH
mgnify:FL=1